jgi:hypothetical protein
MTTTLRSRGVRAFRPLPDGSGTAHRRLAPARAPVEA